MEKYRKNKEDLRFAKKPAGAAELEKIREEVHNEMRKKIAAAGMALNWNSKAGLCGCLSAALIPRGLGQSPINNCRAWNIDRKLGNTRECHCHTHSQLPSGRRY